MSETEQNEMRALVAAAVAEALKANVTRVNSNTRAKAMGPGQGGKWTMADLNKVNAKNVTIHTLCANPKQSGQAREIWDLQDGSTIDQFYGMCPYGEPRAKADLRYNLERGFVELHDANDEVITLSSLSR